MAVVRSVVMGCGGYLPHRVVTNQDLESFVDTDDLWIRQRTGIYERRVVAEGETTADMALAAARCALSDSGLEASEIDLLVLATTTPNQTFPSTAVAVQVGLGITHGAAFDIQAVCSGFIYALSTADAHLQTGRFKCSLVIGAESFSRLLDWGDRSSCVLFGDGAGAVVLRATEQLGQKSDRGVLYSKLRSDGRYIDKLYADGGPSTTGTVGRVRMKGQEVFKCAVNFLVDLAEEALSESGFSLDDVDWFVLHQANIRIIDSIAERLSFPKEKVIITIAEHANTSAASIPLALSVACKQGKIKKGDLILMEAMGAGFAWGLVFLRW